MGNEAAGNEVAVSLTDGYTRKSGVEATLMMSCRATPKSVTLPIALQESASATLGVRSGDPGSGVRVSEAKAPIGAGGPYLEGANCGRIRALHRESDCLWRRNAFPAASTSQKGEAAR
jgi:hypothetical protein